MRTACVLLLYVLSLATLGTAEGGPLRAGAARIDITPVPDAALPMAGYASRKQGFKGIHDHAFLQLIERR